MEATRPTEVCFYGEPPTHLTYPALEAAGARHAFTTRHHAPLAGPSAPGGPFGASGSSVAMEALGHWAGALSFARQVHGADAVLVQAEASGLVGTGDALITATPRRPLAVFTADCLAVILVDPRARLLAVAHAGWRGTVAGILGRVVDILRGLGADSDRLQAAIGPSIGPCCYEVDRPVVVPLRAAFGSAAGPWLADAGPGRWRLDLWQANTDQLVAAGLRPGAIQNPRLCTGCRPDLFFSYRKEGSRGRLAALATLP